MDTTSLAPLQPADLLPEPAAPNTVLSALARPLTLHAGHAYAAAWTHLRDPHAADNPAPVHHALVIVRDDGQLSQPLASASALARLPGGPPFPVERLWSPAGLTAYHAGHRPDPAAVFRALVQVFDTFIDFNHSTGTQTQLCELLAVYVLATWLQPAFPSFPHLWILGDTGSGKSRLLHLLARLTHLGLVVPAAAPAAALRDLSALGAALALDNADGLFNSLVTGETFRPAAATQRQAVFLGGAQRGVLYPSRRRLTPRGQPAAYGLTHADLFGPRLFAAQFAPPPAVATRALYLPLLRSTDRARCRAHPHLPAAWPVAPRALLDDLWALALSRLPQLPAHLAATAARADLVSAYFETWHPLLAVADWLTTHGLPGLYARLHALATAYPARVAEIAPQAVDRTVLVLHAIYGYLAHAVAEMVAADLADLVAADPAQSRLDQTAGHAGSQHTTARPAGHAGSQRTTAGPAGHAGSQRTTAGPASHAGSSRSRVRPSPAEASAAPPDLPPALVAKLRCTPYSFSASMLLPVVRGLAEKRGWYAYAADLTREGLGHTLKQLCLPKVRRNNTRFYKITLPELERLLDAYRLPLPSPLTTYPRFAQSALLATLPPLSSAPPNTPRAPLHSNSPLAAYDAYLTRLFASAPPPPPPPPYPPPPQPPTPPN
ncbi:MAG: hypothetical protein IT317_14830, partial [Anaerolineales bacterium]|nr:hypothetical protein [Anaerolineales bacterium]